MKMKKMFLLFVVSLFAVALLVGCAENGDTEDAADDTPVEDEVDETEDDAAEDESADEGAALEGTITMAGSTSVQPLSEELAAVFMEEHQGARLEVSGGGSGSGVTAAQESTADFGAASREIREDETGIDHYVIAIDGIAIIVHPDNEGVDDISIEDVQGIFTGEITNWSEVGGADEDIVVVSREEGSGTRGAFDDIVLGDEALVDTALIQNSGGSVRESIASEPNAIGYLSTGSLNDDVKALNIDGVEPTPENIVAGDYSVARPFNYMTNEDEPLSELAQAYLDFVLSDEGQNVVEDQGYVKVN